MLLINAAYVSAMAGAMLSFYVLSRLYASNRDGLVFLVMFVSSLLLAAFGVLTFMKSHCMQRGTLRAFLALSIIGVLLNIGASIPYMQSAVSAISRRPGGGGGGGGQEKP